MTEQEQENKDNFYGLNVIFAIRNLNRKEKHFINFKCDIRNEKFKNKKSMKNHIQRVGGR